MKRLARFILIILVSLTTYLAVTSCGSQRQIGVYLPLNN